MTKIITMSEGDLQELKATYFESFNRFPPIARSDIPEIAIFFPHEIAMDKFRNTMATQGIKPSPSVFGHENQTMVERIEGENHSAIKVLNYRDSAELTAQLSANGYERQHVSPNKRDDRPKKPSELLGEIKEKLAKARMDEMGLGTVSHVGRGR